MESKGWHTPSIRSSQFHTTRTTTRPLYERLNLRPGRLELMTGIKERRFWPADMNPSVASAQAGRNLLKKGIAPDGIDLLIHSAVCRDRLEPATASYVHGLMDLGGNTQILTPPMPASVSSTP